MSLKELWQLFPIFLVEHNNEWIKWYEEERKTIISIVPSKSIKVYDLTGKFIADIVLQILSYVAQIERENTYQRQMEGIKEAKKRGVKFGRSKIDVSKDFEKVANQWSKKEISLRAGAKQLNVSHTTFLNG